jgi:hypothetical protein
MDFQPWIGPLALLVGVVSLYYQRKQTLIASAAQSSTVLQRRWWLSAQTIALCILVILAWGPWIISHVNLEGFSGLTPITGQLIRNTRITVDGHNYAGNKLQNVTIAYNGGIGKLEHNVINGFDITTDDIKIWRFVMMLNDLGLLKVAALDEHGQSIKPTNPIRP